MQSLRKFRSIGSYSIYCIRAGAQDFSWTPITDVQCQRKNPSSFQHKLFYSCLTHCFAMTYTVDPIRNFYFWLRNSRGLAKIINPIQSQSLALLAKPCQWACPVDGLSG